MPINHKNRWTKINLISIFNNIESHLRNTCAYSQRNMKADSNVKSFVCITRKSQKVLHTFINCTYEAKCPDNQQVLPAEASLVPFGFNFELDVQLIASIASAVTTTTTNKQLTFVNRVCTLPTSRGRGSLNFRALL